MSSSSAILDYSPLALNLISCQIQILTPNTVIFTASRDRDLSNKIPTICLRRDKVIFTASCDQDLSNKIPTILSEM